MKDQKTIKPKMISKENLLYALSNLGFKFPDDISAQMFINERCILSREKAFTNDRKVMVLIIDGIKSYTWDEEQL